MMAKDSSQELVEFPCHFEFKAFGPGGADSPFFDQVRDAVSTIVPVSRQAMKSRASSAGKYQCVSVLVSLQNRTQMENIYTELRKVDGLKYLL